MTPRLRTVTVLAGLLLLVAAGWLSAQAPKPAPAKPAAPPPATKRLRVEAKHVVSEKTVGKIRQTTLSDARLYQDDALFTADTVVIQSEDNVHTFTCTGNPVYKDPETSITADKLVGNSTPRWAEFTGNVKMVNTPKTKPAANGGELNAKLTGEPTTVTCASLSYDYGKKTAQARGNVVVTQPSRKRTLWADEGIYDQTAELITLTGNVRMKNDGEEELKEMKNGDKVTISLENDWLDITSPAEGYVEFLFDVKEENAPAPTKPAANGEKK